MVIFSKTILILKLQLNLLIFQRPSGSNGICKFDSQWRPMLMPPKPYVFNIKYPFNFDIKLQKIH